jgi:tetratricopeptide (TPR) repeat protein
MTILVSIAIAALLLIIARWLLPVMGFAGLEDETIEPLVRMTPAVVGVLVLSLAALWFFLWRQSRMGFARARRLVDEAEDWSEGYIIGESLERSILAYPVDQAEEVRSPEVELSYNGLRPAYLSSHSSSKALGPQTKLAGQTILPPAEPCVEPIRKRMTARIISDPVEAPPEVEPQAKTEDTGELTFDEGFIDDSRLEIKSPAESNLHQIPPPLPEFAGRTIELAELIAAQVNPQIKVLALQGTGGVGKTTLAVKLAHQLMTHYPDAQIYIDLKGANALPLAIHEAQAQIIRAFLPAARLPESQTELNQMYQAVLKGKWALLLFDNVTDAKQVSPLLPSESCLSIVTSRQYVALPGIFVTRLDCMPPAEARELLNHIVPRIGDRADRIAELCGRLPLALRLAGSALTQHPELSAEDYARRLEAMQRSEKPVKPIDAVVKTGYELLAPELQKFWRTLAVFTDTFDVNAASAVWRINPASAADALDRLMAYSLIERNRANGRYRLHDLMLKFAEGCLSDDERLAARRLHSAHYQGVLHEADALYEQGGQCLKQGLALLDREWHNIQAGQIWAATWTEQCREACELCASYPDAGKYVLDLRQHPRERIRWSEAALNAAKILRRRKAAARHLIALGNAYIDLSEAQRAIDCYEQALVYAREINDRPGEADALSGLGTAYHIGGGLNRARESHGAALEIAKGIKDQRAEAVALGNLGAVYFTLGEARVATELYDRQLKLARQIGDRRIESGALGGLGLAHYSLNNAKLAADLFNQQLAITREIGDRQGEAGGLCFLGNACASLKDYRQAIAYNEQSLAIAREIGDRRNEANALGGLGGAYFSSGDVEVAEQFFEQQRELAVEIGDRRSEGMAQIKLGEACLVKGNTRRAIEVLQRAFDITSQIGDLQGEAHSLFKLALALDQYGDRAQAVAQAETALTLFRLAEHPDAEVVRKQLGEWGRV